MGSIPLDNSESVYIHDGTGSSDPIAISAAEGSSVANLMKNRERFDYTWADAAERAAQTGMVQGSRGYQRDTKTEYVYDNSIWRLSLPYIEFSATNQVLTAGQYVQQTNWSVNSGNSTDTSMVTISGGVLTFVRAGIYSMSATGSTSAGSFGNDFQVLSTDASHLVFVSIAGYVGGVSTLGIPFFRVTADNTPYYLWAYSANGGTLSGRVLRIGRLG